LSIQRIRHIQPHQTAAWIVSTAEHAAGQPEIIHLARSIIREVQERDPIAETLAIYDFLRSKIRYTKDPERFEVVFGPIKLLELWKRYGKWSEDCDTISAAAYSLLRSIGHTCRVKVVAFIADQAGPVPEHIFCESYFLGRWFACDPSLPPDQVKAMLTDTKWFWTYGPQ
jgi:transglutaminase-like putative cysteine protease